MKHIKSNELNTLYFINTFEEADLTIISITEKIKKTFKVKSISPIFGKISINIHEKAGNYTYILKDLNGILLESGMLKIYENTERFQYKDKNLTFTYT